MRYEEFYYIVNLQLEFFHSEKISIDFKTRCNFVTFGENSFTEMKFIYLKKKKKERTFLLKNKCIQR